MIPSTKQKLPHISDVASRSHTAPPIPHSISYKWVTIMSLKERDIDPISRWKEYKRHIVRENHVGWEILLRHLWAMILENTSYYTTWFSFKSFFLKKICPVLTLQILFLPLFFWTFESILKVSFALCPGLWIRPHQAFPWLHLLGFLWDSLISHKYLI